MFAEERQSRIIARLEDAGRVTVSELAREFEVTSETVRRDFDVLESQGKLVRVHGGAVAPENSSMLERSLSERILLHAEEKQRIARAALAQVPRGENASVLLDSGSTTESLAKLLASNGNQALVITNSLAIAADLSTVDFPVEVLGGRVRGTTSAMVGMSAERQLGELRPDIAFVGANGISIEFGLSTPDRVEARIKTAMLSAARKVVLLADSTKLGNESLVRFGTLADIDVLITDVAPTKELDVALHTHDVEVVVA